MLSFKPTFSLSSFTYIFFVFCHKGGVICISEVIDISPSNLDSCLWLIQPNISHMYSAYKLNKQGDSIQPWRTPFPIWNQSVVPCPVNRLFFSNLFAVLNSIISCYIETRKKERNKCSQVWGVGAWRILGLGKTKKINQRNKGSFKAASGAGLGSLFCTLV